MSAAVGLVVGGSAPPATAAVIDDSSTVYTTDRCGAVDFVDYGLAGVEHKNLLMMVSVGVPAEARRRFQDAANGPSLLSTLARLAGFEPATRGLEGFPSTCSAASTSGFAFTGVPWSLSGAEVSRWQSSSRVVSRRRSRETSAITGTTALSSLSQNSDTSALSRNGPPTARPLGPEDRADARTSGGGRDRHTGRAVGAHRSQHAGRSRSEARRVADDMSLWRRHCVGASHPEVMQASPPPCPSRSTVACWCTRPTTAWRSQSRPLVHIRVAVCSSAAPRSHPSSMTAPPVSRPRSP